MSTVCDRFRGAEKASSGEREMSYTRWMEKEGRLGVVHKKEGGGGGVTEKQGERWGRGEQQRRGQATTQGGRGRGSEREEGLFVDHWQIMGSLGQT